MRLGGCLAVVVSAVLLALVVARDVGVNPLNGWTILIGAFGGVLALRPRSPVPVLFAWALVLLAMLPALLGGLGLLYVPSLLLILAGGRLAFAMDDQASHD